MERRRSSTGRGEAVEHGGGARLRPELVEISRSDLEKIRSVNRCNPVKRPVRVSGEAAEATVVDGTPVHEGRSCNSENLEERETKAKKKTTGDYGEKNGEEGKGGREEGGEEIPPSSLAEPPEVTERPHEEAVKTLL
jgi:hypothetical protein